MKEEKSSLTLSSEQYKKMRRKLGIEYDECAGEYK